VTEVLRRKCENGSDFFTQAKNSLHSHIAIKTEIKTERLIDWCFTPGWSA